MAILPTWDLQFESGGALSSRTHRFMPGLRAAWAFEVIQIAALGLRL